MNIGHDLSLYCELPAVNCDMVTGVTCGAGKVERYYQCDASGGENRCG
jgi:hypothetical protein